MIDLLTRSQAASKIGLHVRSFDKLVTQGKIAVHVIGPDGGKRMFSVEDLEGYIKRCRKVGKR